MATVAGASGCTRDFTVTRLLGSVSFDVDTEVIFRTAFRGDLIVILDGILIAPRVSSEASQDIFALLDESVVLATSATMILLESPLKL